MPTAAEQAGRVVPRELPAPVAHFAGRATELAALSSLLDQRDELMPGTLVISAIGGTAGVGKTALPVRWAHQMAGRFPDGQLYVNLRGYDADQPLPPADALAGFLRSLGVPGHDIPPEPDQRAALTGTTIRQARRALDTLARTHLLSPTAPGRYGMHDLLRGYARELVTADTGEEQHAALTRLFDHYLHTAATAMDTLYAADRHLRPRIRQPATPAPPLSGPAAARDWLDDERAALVAAAGHAAIHAHLAGTSGGNDCADKRAGEGAPLGRPGPRSPGFD